MSTSRIALPIDKLKEQDSSCYENARRRGLDTFTLTGSDLSSPKVIFKLSWAINSLQLEKRVHGIDCAVESLVFRESVDDLGKCNPLVRVTPSANCFIDILDFFGHHNPLSFSHSTTTSMLSAKRYEQP